MLLLALWIHEYSVEKAADQAEVSVPTVRRYYRLFRLHIVKSVEFKPQNNVQVDEAYFGQYRKMSNYYHGYKLYRVQEKVCVAGISCPDTGQLACRVILGVKTKPIQAFIREVVPRDVLIYSDGSAIYNDLRRTHRHISQTHDLGFHHAYYIEGCWSWMKRKLFKMYHHFERRYADEYIAELTWRFNTRKLSKDPVPFLRNSL